MGRIEAKACIVTGAASGIGRVTAERFAEEGGQVLCVDVDGDGVREDGGADPRDGTAEAEEAEVAVRGQAEDFVARCVELWGGIDVLVNNAGVNLPGVFHEAPDETIERTLAVNVKGPIYASQAAIPHMLERGNGSIVNVSSVNGVIAEPYLTVYAASKGAVVMLSRGIALDYAKQGIRCNAICRAGSTRRSTTPTPRCSADWRKSMSRSTPFSRLDARASHGDRQRRPLPRLGRGELPDWLRSLGRRWDDGSVGQHERAARSSSVAASDEHLPPRATSRPLAGFDHLHAHSP